MKNIRFKEWPKPIPFKMNLKMKLTTILLIVSLFKIHANSYSQNTKISLNHEEISIGDVFKEIEHKSEFRFLYKNKELDSRTTVSIHISKGNIYEILNRLFKELPIKYEVLDNRQIILTKQPPKIKIPKESIPIGNLIEQISVSGSVADANGTPLPGANVVEKGTTNGVTADFDGQFSIEVTDNNATLVVSYIGFATKEVELNGQSVITVFLEESSAGLDEVVVIGYGSVKKSDMTGSVSSIKSDKLLDRPTVNVSQALSGRLAGVEVFSNSGRPDGKVTVRIRGNNSISASNEPLYVVDGIIGVSDIGLINPSNIESLEVLKDASATAIYGSRGANGVILITTKGGTTTGESTISYDAWTSMGVLSKNQNIEFLNSNEWWQVYNTGFDNIEKYDPSGFAIGKYQRAQPEAMPRLFDANGNPIYDTDWEEETYRTAISHNHQFSIRGGNQKTSYSLNLNYLNQQALMVNNYFKRYSGQVTVDSEVKSWLSAGVNVSYNYSKGNELYGNYQLKRLQQEALPIIPVKYPDGTWASNRDFPGAVQDTPSRYLEEMVNEENNSQVLANLYFDFKILDDLRFKSTLSIDSKDQKNNYYTGRNLIQFGGKTNGGIARINTQKQIYWQNENFFSYKKEINESHNLDILLGLSWQQRYAELLGAEHRNFVDDFYQWHNLGAGTVSQPSSSSDWKWSLNSYFARANYNFKNKYLFTATGRYDGSSRFGDNNKFAFFPSVAFAWRVSQESFLEDSQVVNNLKLRASWGKTGNQEISNYAYSPNLGSGNVIFADTFSSALFTSNFGNRDLKWETTAQFDVGLDFGLFKQRLEVGLDYYNKTTDDLLLNTPIPSTSGLTSVFKNIGSIKNKGFEATLKSFNMISDNFTWSTSLAFTTNRNKVLKLGTNDEDIFTTRHAQGFMKILRVGEPVGSFWGLTRLGTWNTDEADAAAVYNRLPGDLKFEDINNDGNIDANDNTIIGRDSPDWTMGISNTFTYKNFDLLFDVRIVEGMDVMNAGTHTREDRTGVAQGSKTLLDAWTPSNQDTMIAELRYMRTYYDSFPDTRWLQDGSFIRLQNLSLGYTFPTSSLEKFGLNKLRMYVSGQNLLMITDYKGYDPEISTFEGSFGQGIDDFGEPRSQTYTFGLNLNF